MDSSKNIYQRINDVMKEVTYVQKDKAISGAGASYKAVTHDQVVSVARQSLVKYGVMVYPEQVEGKFLQMRDMSATPPVKMGLYSGSYMINFVNIDRGDDKISVAVQAHAKDNGDKAPGKALTYATKAAILKVLCLETGDNDESREEIRDKANTISQDQYDQLANYCVNQTPDGAAWNETAGRLLKAYGINNLTELPASKFDGALERCKKAALS